MNERPEVSQRVVEQLRAVCLGMPEAREEAAWVGTRWRIRTRTFAHVLTVSDGWPPAYARAASTDGPATVLMFRSSGPELAALHEGGPPFFSTPWRADEIGIVIDGDTDWDEVAELVTESYRLLAPEKLARRVD
jgi:predicted DNA-binding protein (MmcQ/YjbR family)